MRLRYAYYIERGQVDGIDGVARTLLISTHIPSNVLRGNWRVAQIVDDGAAPEQQEAIVRGFSREVGERTADLAGLVREVRAIETAPISFAMGQAVVRLSGKFAYRYRIGGGDHDDHD